VKKIWIASKDFLERLLNILTDEETFLALFNHWIDSNTSERFKKANQRLDHLLVDREKRPITYNHYYTETLQDLRRERLIEVLRCKIQSFMGTSSNSFTAYSQTFDITKLATSLSIQQESDMDGFACSELLDSMQAYYKVSKPPNLLLTCFPFILGSSMLMR
jgi:hypothetical protein